MRRVLLYGFLICSIIIICILYFFEYLKIPVLFNLNPDSVNKLLETISIAYITSFIFYLIVVVTKNIEDKNKVYKILEEPFIVFINDLCAVYKTKIPQPSTESINVKELLLTQIPEIIDQKESLYANSIGTNIIDGQLTQISWIEWLKKINDRFLSDTNDLFSKYSFFLDVETGIKYEKLKISDYTRLVNSACMVRNNNLEQLELNQKFKVHHEDFLIIFQAVFKKYKNEIKYDDNRFSFNMKS